MPRTKISEYSTTNSDNTDIESININEGCAPSGINNAIRELMVHLKEFQTGASSDPLTVAGTFVASGGATIAASAGTSASPSIHFSGDTNTGIFSPAADTIAFAEGGVESMRITSAGELLIGTTTAASTQGGNLQVITHAAIRRNLAGTGGGALRFEKSRSATDGGYTIVQDGDQLGEVQFFGSDGVDFAHAATVRGIVNGTPGSNDMPGALAFLTSADGTQSPTERMRITSAGNVGIGTDAPESTLHVVSATNTTQLSISNTGTTVVANDIVGAIGFKVNDNNRSAQNTDFAFIRTLATQTHTATAAGTAITFGTTPDNSLVVAERMRITSEGEVLVGGTTSLDTVPSLSIQGTGSGSLGGAGRLNFYRPDITVTAGEAFGVIAFYGNDTTSNTPTNHAYINAIASGTHAAGDNPTDLVFATTPDGSETVAEAMRLTQAKSLKIGGTASRATTEGTNQVVLFNGTAPVGTLTNGVSFYSAAGEARVMDAAGNSTLLSPHDQSTNEWIFHSKHTPSGKVLRIDVERLLKFVNDHFGLDAVHEFIEQ